MSEVWPVRFLEVIKERDLAREVAVLLEQEVDRLQRRVAFLESYVDPVDEDPAVAL